MPPWVQGCSGRPHSCQLLERKSQETQHLQKHNGEKSKGYQFTGFLGDKR